MQCRSCGTVLQPGAMACPSCGTPVPSAPPDFSLYESSSNTVPYIPYAPSVEPASASSSQQSSPHPQLSPTPPPSPGPQLYMGAPPFPGAPRQPSPSQQQRSGLSAGMVALLVILALLFVAAGSGLTYYLLALRPAQYQAQVTPITATNPQDLYMQATSGTPTFNDPLSPQNTNQWHPAFPSGSCTFTGNALNATAPPTSSPPTASVCVARSTNFDNFAYQARATIIQGNQAGLFFRFDPHGPGPYFFEIESDGLYVLVASDSQGNRKLLAGASSSAINTGLHLSNLLTVIARGSMIYLYINQQYLTSISDSTSSSGRIGVDGGDARGGSVDVAFSEIQVWKL